jgi:hypothetical protein
MEIKPTYATYSQSKILKEKGFSVPCQNTISLDFVGEVRNSHQYQYVDWNNFIPIINPSLGKCFISCPDHWQIVKWLKINHGIFISIGIIKPVVYVPKLISITENGYKTLGSDKDLCYRYTEEEAYSTAFDYILTKL